MKRRIVTGAFLVMVLIGGAASAEMEPTEEALTREDLVAQQGMNRSTKALVMLGWMQLAVAGLGTVAVVASLGFSTRALKLTRDALDLQRTTAEQELRAYIGAIVPEKSINPDTNEASIVLFIQNFGATPTFNARSWATQSWVEGFPESVEVAVPKYETFEPERGLAPGQKARRGWHFPLSKERRQQLASKEVSAVFTWVYVYQDAFGSPSVHGLSIIMTGDGLARNRQNKGLAIPGGSASLGEV